MSEKKLQESLSHKIETLFYPEKAKKAHQILGQLFKHPNLYVCDDLKTFYLIPVDGKHRKRIGPVNFIEFLCSVTGSVVIDSFEFDRVTLELINFGVPKEYFLK